MASGPLRIVVDHLHRLGMDGATDGRLLDEFIAHRDEAAFAALVRRHGPMVLGVCRRVVGDIHDADDAFQATFFILARKAEKVHPRDMVGNWLYGVAYRTALKARSLRLRRRTVERQVLEMPQPAMKTHEVWLELQPVLDQELGKLPDSYRAPVVLCDLEGRSRKEAAKHLAIPEGTLSSRLARGRQMLARRLGRRGIALSAGVMTAALAQHATAAVPMALASATIKTAAVVAAGAAGVVPTAVAVLMNGTFKSLILSKLTTVGSLLLAALVGTSVAVTRLSAPPAEATPTTAASLATPRQPSDEESIQGTWDLVSLESDGKSVAVPPEWRDGIVTFDKDTVHTRISGAEENASVHFKLGNAATPKTIDVLVEGAARSTGIYQIEDDSLTICLAPAGCERPTQFRTTEGSAVLLVLRPTGVGG